MDGNEKIEIDIETVLQTTDRAYLVSMPQIDDNFTVWFPKSQCSLGLYNESIFVPRWLLLKKADEFQLEDFYELAGVR